MKQQPQSVRVLLTFVFLILLKQYFLTIVVFILNANIFNAIAEISLDGKQGNIY